MDYRAPVPVEVRFALNKIGRDIGALLPDGWGFALLVFTFGPGGTMTWISNAQRPDMLQALQEFQTLVGSHEPNAPGRN
jgi:hypothetical protein